MSDRTPDADDDDAGQDDVQDTEDVEKVRAERLDPDNRPEGAEVDNSDREFDDEIGQFTDHEPDPDLGPFEVEGETEQG